MVESSVPPLVRPWLISRSSLILLFLATGLQFYYLGYTPPFTRSYDADGHAAYIQHLHSSGELPRRSACYECYHPPLYYLLGVPVSRIGPLGPDNLALVSLQKFSILLFMGFLYFGVLLIESSTRDPGIRCAFVLLICFWPSGVLHAPRIGNDALLYAMYAPAFYLLARGRLGVAAATLTALALLSKANGIVLYGLWLALCARRLHQERRAALLWDWIPAWSVLAVGLGLLSAWAAYNREGLTTQNAVVGNMDVMVPLLAVETTPKTLALFEPILFLRYPDIGVHADGRGRQYFWNCALKTCLLAEFDIRTGYHSSVAILLSYLFLVLLGLSALGASLLRRRDPDAFFLHTSHLAIGFAALLALRIAKPVVCSGDFRYIYPCLFSMAAFMAETLASPLPLLRRGAAASIAGFVLLSIAFFLVPPAAV